MPLLNRSASQKRRRWRRVSTDNKHEKDGDGEAQKKGFCSTENTMIPQNDVMMHLTKTIEGRLIVLTSKWTCHARTIKLLPSRLLPINLDSLLPIPRLPVSCRHPFFFRSGYVAVVATRSNERKEQSRASSRCTKPPRMFPPDERSIIVFKKG